MGKVGNQLDDLPVSQLSRAGPAHSQEKGPSARNNCSCVQGRSIAMSEAVIFPAGQSMCLKSRKQLDTARSHLCRMVVRRGGVVDGMIEKYQIARWETSSPTTTSGKTRVWITWDACVLRALEHGLGCQVTLPYYADEVDTNYLRRRDGARILGHSCYRPDRHSFCSTTTTSSPASLSETSTPSSLKKTWRARTSASVRWTRSSSTLWTDRSTCSGCCERSTRT